MKNFKFLRRDQNNTLEYNKQLVQDFMNDTRSWQSINMDYDPDIMYLSTGIGVAINYVSAGNANDPFSLVLYDRDEDKYEGLMVSFNTFKLLLRDIMDNIHNVSYTEIYTGDFFTYLDKESGIIEISNENRTEGDISVVYHYDDVYELIETFEQALDFDWDYYGNTPPPGFDDEE